MLRLLTSTFTFLSVIITLFVFSSSTVVGLYAYHRLVRDMPRIERIEDYTPPAVTTVFDQDKKVVAELYAQRRYPVSLEEVPLHVQHAVLAAEDADFYSHPGFDVLSILRAAWANYRARDTVQGASTITQQVVKSLLLTSEKTIERKIKEALLAFKLERSLSKPEIFTIYLNEIFFGQTAYGIKAAARVHFQKELDALSIAEAAYLAGLPQKPSYLSRPGKRKEAIARQRYVLSQMRSNDFISEQQHESALEEKLTIYPPDRQQIRAAPYFVSHVNKLLNAQLGNGVTRPGGYEVHTTLDLEAYNVAESAVRKGLREVDKRRGWRGPRAEFSADEAKRWIEKQVLERELVEDEVYEAVVLRRIGNTFEVAVGETRGLLDLTSATWAKKLIGDNDRSSWIDPKRYLKVGHLIEVSLLPAESDTQVPQFQLDQTPIVQGAFVLANALTGEVRAIIGGYDFQTNEFNRATQGLRQPGSAFKPFIYLSAIEQLDFTPSTIVPDSPISLVSGDGSIWSPDNYDHKFLGPITLRTALQRSRNVVSVYLLERVGVGPVIEVARRFGLSTPLPPHMSLSLGTAEVHLFELVRAYGVFAAGGWLAEPLLITKVYDRNGELVIENRPRQKRVLDEDTSFLMAHMMRGVVERGTAQRVKALERPVAGKTGTTNDQMDAWFIGYTPEWVAGAWVGFDAKRMIGKFETGGKAAAPIFVYAMQEFLKDKPKLEFEIPDGVVPFTVNMQTGRLTSSDDPNAFLEYFKSGTEPRTSDEEIEIPKGYLSGEDF